MAIDYRRLERVLERCGEIGTAAEADPSVKRVYDDFVADDAAKFRSAHKAAKDANAKAKKERKEGLEALDAINQPYLKTRSVAGFYIKDLAIPAALTTLDTETEKAQAIIALLELLEEHAEPAAPSDEPDEPDEPESNWAQELLVGDFGVMAPDAIREINEWTAASVELSAAVRARATAYGLAYEAYLDFKELVRNHYGRSSIQYRRIHVRRGGKLQVDDPDDQ